MELSFILLSEFWIRTLSCLLCTTMIMSVQVMKGSALTIPIKVAGILHLLCVISECYNSICGTSVLFFFLYF